MSIVSRKQKQTKHGKQMATKNIAERETSRKLDGEKEKRSIVKETKQKRHPQREAGYLPLFMLSTAQ